VNISWLYRLRSGKTMTDEQLAAGFFPCQSTPLNL
jgi:hypothetical protein